MKIEERSIDENMMIGVNEDEKKERNGKQGMGQQKQSKDATMFRMNREVHPPVEKGKKNPAGMSRPYPMLARIPTSVTYLPFSPAFRARPYPCDVYASPLHDVARLPILLAPLSSQCES